MNLTNRQRPQLLLSQPVLAKMTRQLGGSRRERSTFLADPGSYIRKNADFSKFKDIQIITNEKELENVKGGTAVAALAVVVVVAAGVHMTVVATNAVVAAAAVVVYAGVWFWGGGGSGSGDGKIQQKEMSYL